ncbi:purine-nucleoside phosphorylase [Aliifodinibius sp. S!AR15-10]|uniref:purine-nucleoside phosphorylase n=1 Tax=Aliifodinibius sp. S!AR15-10 TaxID=2950437 RepID=UPI0028676DE5|nr:purine-nucleoside phosphorylase [Aliifodinibius sp. S!AR15-10]MDR8392919.1 purine-nucleoside phosphorylase [Aliifodinibius sp. S!AR15-10]
MSLPDHLEEITASLLEKGVAEAPEAVIILGSGLGSFSNYIENSTHIPYSSIPHFPATSVQGHSGELITGEIEGHPIIAFSGRFHHYEGFTFEQTALPVYVADILEAEKLIISNAAGAINTAFNVGDLMVIEDVMRQNFRITPRGKSRFRYSHYQWVDTVRELAAKLGIATRQGTYIYVKGPNYETKAEIQAFRTIGADAVGMSTVPELMEAARLGIKTAAISLISNMAAGVTDGKLNHDEVTEAADLRKDDFSNLVQKLIKEL